MDNKNGTEEIKKAATITTTEVDTEYDILDELATAINEIETAIQKSETENLDQTFAYVRFLIKEMKDNLSGNYEELRRQRFISKKSK